MFDGCLDKLFQFGEADDAVKRLFHLYFFHAQNRPVQENIFSSCQFRMETGAYFNHRGDAAVNFHITGTRFSYTSQEFQNSTLARAVAADKANGLTLLDLEGNVLQGPEIVFQRSDGRQGTGDGRKSTRDWGW